jgi:choline dehydrogenase-like flavoprotein
MAPPLVHDCIVVGSGSSGVACATALLAAGRTVLMIDAGLTIEPDLATAVAAARKNGPVNATTAPWASEPSSKEKIPRKRLYGSDFPFQQAAERLRLASTDVGAEPSFARGGFSNIWGASALPFAAGDTQDWPISPAELAPHYVACAKLLGIAGEIDDIADWLPFYATPHGHLRASRQATTMLQKLSSNRERLRAEGVRFGRARVAVKTPPRGACTYCGLCLHGCPDKLIYSSNDTLAELISHPRFSYKGGIAVERISEVADRVTVHASGLQSGEDLLFNANRAFVAAGAISTTGILLRSSGAYDKPVLLKDAQYFVLPMLQFRGVGKTRDEMLHTMAQLFLEIRDQAISPFTVHLQVYTYSKVLGQTVRKRLGALLEPLSRWGDAHFILVQGYLHSDHSGAIEMTLKHGEYGDRLEARGVVNPDTRRRIAAVIKKLSSLARATGAMPLSPMMEVSHPGRGFHHGGSFPMSASPGEFETDLLGRPFGWKLIHVVDATVLPSIPATTITYPVMANAHRIATDAFRGTR